MAPDSAAGASRWGSLRIKVTSTGSGEMIVCRPRTHSDRTTGRFHAVIEDVVDPDDVTFDGQVFFIRTKNADKVIAALKRRYVVVTYAPALLRNLTGLPNRWKLEEEAADHGKPIAYMARVWHPEYAEAIAFQLPRSNDDFLIDFRQALSRAKKWQLYNKDFEVWAVADHYEPLVHDVLDRHYFCYWEEFMAGEEWNILSPPKGTQYPIRQLSHVEFDVLEVAPFCSIPEANEGFRRKKEQYKSHAIGPEEYMEVDMAYQRIRRHHFPEDSEDLPENVVGVGITRDVLDAAGLAFEYQEEQVAWFHKFSDALGGRPIDLCASDGGRDRVLTHLRLLVMMNAKDKKPR